MLLEDFTVLVLWSLLAITCINVVFLFSVVMRRLARAWYFRRKDAARDRFAPIVARFAAAELSMTVAVRQLKVRGAGECDALEELLFAAICPKNHERITDLLFTLGVVGRWARAAFGPRWRIVHELARTRNARELPPGNHGRLRQWLLRRRIFAVSRATAMAELGKLAPPVSAVFALAGLGDSSAQVRLVALLALAHPDNPGAIPYLLNELESATAGGNDLSIRSIKAALVRYRPEQLDAFTPFLRHPEARVRFLAVDAAREVCERADRRYRILRRDLPEDLCRIVLHRAISEPSDDVRARAARLVGYLRDEDAALVLRRLLRDGNEFVRMHAVRGCADPAYLHLLPDIAERLFDLRWRVREAAARALVQLGMPGVRTVLRALVQTNDRYAAEQVAEQIQRSGLTHEIASGLLAGGVSGELSRRVCRRLVAMGKSSSLLQALRDPALAQPARLALLEFLAVSPTIEFVQTLQTLSGGQGPLARRAAMVLQWAEPAAEAAYPEALHA